MAHNSHDLQLTVLGKQGSVTTRLNVTMSRCPYLEPLVLKDSLDGSVLAARSHLGLKDNTEGAITHNLALSVGDLLGLAGQSILDLLPDDLYPRSVSPQLKSE